MNSTRAGTMRADHSAEALSSTAASGAEATTSPSDSLHAQIAQAELEPPVSDRLTTASSI